MALIKKAKKEAAAAVEEKQKAPSQVKSSGASQYMIETEKAVQIASREKERLKRSASPKQRIEVIDQLLKESKNYEEFEQLEREKKMLELSLRQKGTYTLIPEEHQEKIKQNKEIELSVLQPELDKQYQNLREAVSKIEGVIMPLLQNIYELEQRADIAKQVDRLLRERYYREGFHDRLYFISDYYGTAGRPYSIKQHKESVQKVLHSIKGLAK